MSYMCSQLSELSSAFISMREIPGVIPNRGDLYHIFNPRAGQVIVCQSRNAVSAHFRRLEDII